MTIHDVKMMVGSLFTVLSVVVVVAHLTPKTTAAGFPNTLQVLTPFGPAETLSVLPCLSCIPDAPDSWGWIHRKSRFRKRILLLANAVLCQGLLFFINPLNL
ncbi:uncharacterized protein LOC143033793 [Oratosquilla oratoria]|uniref:uncharacterized protein LOC143033793 n=1 Tax=Oratosquilla oratoria TaxID=337810 RepID=UPI003F774275